MLERRPTRASATRSRCAWPTCWRSASTTCRGASIATPRSCERAPAARRDAIAALERILEDPDHRYRVAVILEPIYRKAGDWQKLVGVLDAQLDTVEDRDDRVKILGEMAEIHQRLARIDLAFGCRSRAWLADVDSTTRWPRWRRWRVSARLYGPLVETLQKGAVEATDPDLQARLWAMSARLIEEHLGDPPRPSRRGARRWRRGPTISTRSWRWSGC